MLQGYCSQGATYEQVIENTRDSIALHIRDRSAEGSIK
jgi:predicted RNase H-like HicB family nuclease